MKDITITDLSEMVLKELSKSNLKAKSVSELERYGVEPILEFYNSRSEKYYSLELTMLFVFESRAQLEADELSKYRWRRIRRTALFLEQLAADKALDLRSNLKWEAEHNPFPVSAVEKLNSFESLIVNTRNEMLKIGYSGKTENNYTYDGFGYLLKAINKKCANTFSRELLMQVVDEARELYISGKINRSKFTCVRKTAGWVCSYYESGKITTDCLTNYGFRYAGQNYERILGEYIEFSRSKDLLTESSIYAYSTSVRVIFRMLEDSGIRDYISVTLENTSAVISEYGSKHPRSVEHILQALRSFAKFVLEKHPELPDITPALIGIPAKHKKVYEGYSQDEALKIIGSVDRSTNIGKRDYAMILLAYNTGLRGVDIQNLRFCNIDWKNSEIRIVQAKTGVPLALPLDNETGNAIADYILNARPESACDNIFLRSIFPFTKLHGTWALIAKHSKAVLGDSYTGKHGAHAFRRSIGARMLEAGVPCEIMSDVLGHSTSFALYQYTGASIQNLRQCAGSLNGIEIMQEELL